MGTYVIISPAPLVTQVSKIKPSYFAKATAQFFITNKKNVRLPPLITGKGYFLALDDDKKTTELIGAYSAKILWVKSLAGTHIQTPGPPTVYLALASNPSLAYF